MDNNSNLSFLFGPTPPVLLAPMAGVTDMAFRELCREFGADLTYTEMVSAKGLFYDNARTGELLCTSPSERPAGVQLFGSDPKILADMAQKLYQEHGGEIALIDINMGCPARKIVKNGDGSALMLQPELASRVIRAVADSVPLPVTVKFRKGFDSEHINAVDFAKMAEQSGAGMLTVHGRTREQMYAGRADRHIIAQVKRAVSIPVIGNGDIFSAGDALAMLEDTGCDGVMVARGAMGAPYIFYMIKAALSGAQAAAPAPNERIALAVRHAKRAVELRGRRGVIEMRKHIAWYVSGLPNASALRTRVNGCNTLEELEELLNGYAGGIS